MSKSGVQLEDGRTGYVDGYVRDSLDNTKAIVVLDIEKTAKVVNIKSLKYVTYLERCKLFEEQKKKNKPKVTPKTCKAFKSCRYPETCDEVCKYEKDG